MVNLAFLTTDVQKVKYLIMMARAALTIKDVNKDIYSMLMVKIVLRDVKKDSC